MTLHDKIRTILDNDNYLEDSCDESHCDVIESLTDTDGWDAVYTVLISILRDDSASYDDWHTCAEVIWGTVLDKRKIDDDKIIALLYSRLRPDSQSLESNLAWSIASHLRGVDYLSDYSPTDDPAVAAHMLVAAEQGDADGSTSSTTDL